MKTALSVMLAIVACTAAAPALAAPAATAAAKAIAFTHVRIEDGDGHVVGDGTVVVARGRIVAAGAGARVPAGAEVVDGKGRVLTPGLVATDAQVGLVEVNAEKETADAHVDGQAVPAFRAIDGFNPASPRVVIDRAEGITTEILTPRGALLYGQGYAVDLSGAPDSPARARRAAMFGGFGSAAADSAGGARGGVLLRLREIFDDVRFYAKNKAAYDRAAARPLTLPRVHLEALIDVVNGKLPLVFDVDRAADIRALLAFAKEQRIRVVVNGGAEAWLVAKELAQAKVPVILQPMSAEPYSFDALRARDDAPALLEKAGVTLALSSGATDLGTTRVRQEAGVAVSYGMTHAGALRAITQNPARIFGVGDVGVIAPGQRANLVLWSGDPFETTTWADMVLIDGDKTSLETRQEQLARKYLR